MILFVGKDTTLFRSSSIRYRGWLYAFSKWLQYRMSFDPNVTPELLKTINHYHDLFISEKLKESF